ncbi:unnamed protein product [Rhodiola kirilowii]
MQDRRQLHDIMQGPHESMYDYVEKFNAQEQRCCNLGLLEKLIIEYLLDGLRPLYMMLVDASARGTIMKLSPARVRNLIAEVAENARFREEAGRQNELKLKEMVKMLVSHQVAQVRACEICSATDHKTDLCPSLQEEEHGDVNVVGIYQNCNNHPQQRQFGLVANGSSWRDNNNNTAKDPTQQPQQQHNQSPCKPTENIVKELAITVQQNQAKTDGVIADLSKQMSLIAQIVFELKRDPGKLPSQTIPNPKGNVNAVTLRSGKELKNSEKEPTSESTSL